MADTPLNQWSVEELCGEMAYQWGRHNPETAERECAPLIAELERRTEQAKPIPKGHVRLPDGRDLEVPHEHPRTADGLPAFAGMFVWGSNINGRVTRQIIKGTLDTWPSPTIRLAKSYSSESAARDAATGQTGKGDNPHA